MFKKFVALLKKDVVLTAAAVLAVISCFVVPPDRKYIGYIDYNTLILLFSLMLIVGGLRSQGVFQSIARVLLGRVHTARGVVMTLVALCFFSSMLITNDVSLITFVSFGIFLLDAVGLSGSLCLTVTLMTIAGNLGSMLTPIGNPQNLYLYGLSGLSLPQFLLLMLPYAAAAGVLLAVSSILNAKKNKIEVKWFSELSKVDRVYYYINYEQEDIRFAKDIRLYGAAGTLIAKAAEQIKRTISYDVDKEKELYPLNILDVTVTALRDFGTYLYLGILAILGSITIGQFSQLTAAGGTVNQAVQGVIFNIQDIVKRCSYAYETVKLMEYPPYLQKGTRKVEDLKNPHEIEFRNVSFSYPNTGVQVLKNVSIKIKAGERLSVVGLNGAGKTTFIKLLCRLYDTDEGEILLDGVNIRDYDYDEYMKLFSVVFQDFRLLAFSVQENVLLGREGTPEAVDSVLEKVGLLDKVNTLPHGRDTMMFRQFEKDGVQLSGGEQQKLAIARALFKNAPVVILDEPTAALDPVAEYEIYCRFNELVGGKTAVYISHRLSSCKFCDRIAVFSDCTIKELGTHDELVHKPGGIYAEMFAAQAQYYV